MINILKTILYLVCSPREAWGQIKEANQDAMSIQLNFYYPLLALVTLAAFLGVCFAPDDFVFANCLKKSVLTLSIYLSSYFLSILTLMEVFSRIWRVERNYELFVRIVTYSSSLMLIIKLVVLLFSSFFFLDLANFYVAFIVWECMGVMLPVFENELLKYKLWATFVIIAAIYLYPYLFDALLNYLMK